jgi:germination protein M
LNVNGNPLIDSNGDVVGRLTINDFVDNTEVSTNYNVKLYFANKEGDALIEFVTDINSTGTGSVEELVIKQLINGPTEIGMNNTIPEGTILLNVWKTDGICYVDFNEKFLEKIPGVNDEIVIYSIVNSLVELSDINKVQFLINNKVVDTLWEGIDFDISFERNLELIEETY